MGARVNGDLALRFTADGLTSYSGLELLRCFLQQIHFSDRLRGHQRTCDPGSDYSSVAVIRLILALVILGGRRLRHLQYLAGDPIVLRFAGLTVLPTARTVGRWLSRCSASVRQALVGLNAEVIAESVRLMNLKCLTIDVDGTVCSTGLQVQWARRGYNPHRRKVPSYYPITALLAQTGHIQASPERVVRPLRPTG